MPEIIYKEEGFKPLGACFEVYKDNGCGFHEPVHQERLGIEFPLLGLLVNSGHHPKLEYRRIVAHDSWDAPDTEPPDFSK